MIFKNVIAVLVLLVIVSGCTVRGPSVKLDVPGVEVGVNSGGGGCPPGQAKKGRC